MFPGMGGEGVGSQGLVQEAELLTASGLKCCGSDRRGLLKRGFQEVEAWSFAEHCHQECASSTGPLGASQGSAS